MADAQDQLTAGCVVDPATEDWRTADDAELWHAAQAGIGQAKDEMARRDRRPQRIAAAVAAQRTQQYRRSEGGR